MLPSFKYSVGGAVGPTVGACVRACMRARASPRACEWSVCTCKVVAVQALMVAPN